MRFQKLKNDILGKEYSLSIVYVGEEKSREINKKYRNKDKATNVLSFPLRKNEGEIILCKAVIKREAKEKNREKKYKRNNKKNFEEWLLFLVIHGMLHLKGLLHSSRMERAEKKYFKKYATKHFDRNRHGIQDDKSRGGRTRTGRKKS